MSESTEKPGQPSVLLCFLMHLFALVVTKYQKHILGPLLDRIDIHIEVPRVDYEKLSGDRLGETSDAISDEPAQFIGAAIPLQVDVELTVPGSGYRLYAAHITAAILLRCSFLIPYIQQHFLSKLCCILSNWRARLPIWRGVTRFSHRI